MIAVCPNPYRDTGLAVTEEAVRLLHDEGFETRICPIYSDSAEGLIPPELEVSRLEDIVADCSLAVVIGGDGTILAASRKLADNVVPILGVNLGTKGFMTALEPEELSCVRKAAHGEYRISRRMKLDTELIRDGKTIYRDVALNDAVIHGYGDCINIHVSCNGDRMTEFSGDGVVLSTPTGSTGYSMSAGGPIVEPDAENILISPICPHVMGSRTFVLGPDREVSVRVERLHGRRAYLSVDGNSVVDLANEDIVTVRRAASYTRMVDLGRRSFYETAYEKLR